MTIKAFLKVNLLLLKLRAGTVFKIFCKNAWNFAIWFATQQHISTLRRQKIRLFDVKFSADFNELSLFL